MPVLKGVIVSPQAVPCEAKSPTIQIALCVCEGQIQTHQGKKNCEEEEEA